MKARFDSKLHIELEKLTREIDEVVVHSAYDASNRGNKFVYTPLQAKSSISIIGEPDVVRHISSLPGVSQGVEGTLGLFVRGSNNGGNKVEFNEVPFYSYSHLLGMFSIFSADIIETTTFRPGGIPAQSGNLSSSLLLITPKRTFSKPLNGNISVSPYMTGGYISIPLKTDKISLQVAGRTSLMPWIVNKAMNLESSEDSEDEEDEEIKGQVLDFTAIMDWKVNESNILDFMFYTSNDYFDFKDRYSQNKMNWGNTAFKVGWQSQLTQKLDLKTTVYYTKNNSTQEQLYFDEWIPEKTNSQLRLGSKLDEWSTSSVLQYKNSERLKFKAGVNFQSQKFQPATEKTIYSEQINNSSDLTQKSNLLAGFVGVDYSVTDKYDISVGYRHTFQFLDNNSRNNFDLRFLGDIYLNKNIGIEVSYDRLTQYYHVLEGLPTGWSMNVLTKADEQFPEEITNQLYSGLFFEPEIKNINTHFTIGGYYRSMKNLVSYINTVNIFGLKDASWEDEIDVGKGTSFGLEVSGTFQTKKSGTTIAYTLSKTDREFPNINNGNSYPFKFDRRQILNLQSKYTLVSNTNKKGFKREQILNAVLSYSSGHKTTMAIANYQGILPPYWNDREDGWSFPDGMDENAYNRQEMTTKNGYSMKDYFRVDLAYSFIKYRSKTTYELTISVFNLLNRKNPYLFFYEDDKWQQLSIAPVMPNIRWAVKF